MVLHGHFLDQCRSPPVSSSGQGITVPGASTHQSIYPKISTTDPVLPSPSSSEATISGATPSASEAGILSNSDSVSGHSPEMSSPPTSPLRGIHSTGSLDFVGTPASSRSQGSNSAASKDERHESTEGWETEEHNGSDHSSSFSTADKPSEDQQETDSSPNFGSEEPFEADEPLQRGDSRASSTADSRDSDRIGHVYGAPATEEPSRLSASCSDSTTRSEPLEGCSAASDQAAVTTPGPTLEHTASASLSQEADREAGSGADSWEKLSSGDMSQLNAEMAALQMAPSANSEALSSDASAALQSVDIPRRLKRRSSTSGIIRGADRATEDMSSSEDLLNGQSPDRRYQLLDSTDTLSFSDPRVSPSRGAQGNSLPCKTTAEASAQCEDLSANASPVRAANQSTADGHHSKVTSPSEAETREILAGLRGGSRALSNDSDSEGEDYLGEVMSDLKLHD